MRVRSGRTAATCSRTRSTKSVISVMRTSQRPVHFLVETRRRTPLRSPWHSTTLAPPIAADFSCSSRRWKNASSYPVPARRASSLREMFGIDHGAFEMLDQITLHPSGNVLGHPCGHVGVSRRLCQGRSEPIGFAEREAGGSDTNEGQGVR